MSSVRVQFTGNGQFPLDIKVSEDLSLRQTLIGGAAPLTLTDDAGRPVAATQLEGNAQWNALKARADIRVTTTSTDRKAVTFMQQMVAAAPPVGADDVVIEASLDADYDILGVDLLITATAASTVTLRDAGGGLGNALSPAMADALGRSSDDGSLGITVGAKGLPLVARRGDDQTEGYIIVRALQR